MSSSRVDSLRVRKRERTQKFLPGERREREKERERDPNRSTCFSEIDRCAWALEDEVKENGKWERRRDCGAEKLESIGKKSEGLNKEGGVENLRNARQV